jgi:hypothetical protein
MWLAGGNAKKLGLLPVSEFLWQLVNGRGGALHCQPSSKFAGENLLDGWTVLRIFYDLQISSTLHQP